MLHLMQGRGIAQGHGRKPVHAHDRGKKSPAQHLNPARMEYANGCRNDYIFD